MKLKICSGCRQRLIQDEITFNSVLEYNLNKHCRVSTIDVYSPGFFLGTGELQKKINMPVLIELKAGFCRNPCHIAYDIIFE